MKKQMEMKNYVTNKMKKNKDTVLLYFKVAGPSPHCISEVLQRLVLLMFLLPSSFFEFCYPIYIFMLC